MCFLNNKEDMKRKQRNPGLKNGTAIDHMAGIRCRIIKAKQLLVLSSASRRSWKLSSYSKENQLIYENDKHRFTKQRPFIGISINM